MQTKRNKQHRATVNFSRQTLAVYWSYVRENKLQFFTATIFIPISALLFSTIVPYFLSQAVANLASSTDATRSITLAAAAGCVGAVVNFIGFRTIVKHEAFMHRRMVDATTEQLLFKDATFFSNQRIGALTGKFIDYVNSYIKIQDVLIVKTLSFVIAMGTGLVLISRSSLLLAGLLLVFTAFILAEIRITMKIRTPYRKERKAVRAQIMGEVADSLTNSIVVKTFAKEQQELKKTQVKSKLQEKLYLRDIGIVMTEGTIRNAVTTAFQIMIIGVAIYMLQKSMIDLAAAIFALTYLQRVAAQIFTLGDIVNGYDNAFLEAAPMTEILLAENKIHNAPKAKKLSLHKGEVAFQNVTYAYEDGKEAIRELSLRIQSGEKIGLVGHSGAGKTTITKLLLRFDDLTSGSISIDGQNISAVTQHSLRSAIAYVPQEPMLFHRSLRENIGYAKDGATEAMVESAAKKAHAHDFITELPKGYETIVGERGVKLSGGQRQRVAIARAILKDAPILLLDEATSALDSESESLIQDALWELMEGRTAIVIAHRLSTIQKMDRIIVLDKGEIAEEGTHRELLERKGIYAKLWAHQSGGFIEE